MHSQKNYAVLLGLLSALFFSITFILNRIMALEGGSWIWSASLRFYWMLPFFLIIVCFRKNLIQLLTEMKAHLGEWIIWSTIGFGIFYSMLTYAAAYGPSWLVASTWQVTILAGLLLSPFINRNQASRPLIPRTSLIYSGLILLGIGIMQISHAESLSLMELSIGVLPVVVAAFAYPLGNRKMMQLTGDKLDAYQRILGMLIASLPFWILLSAFGWFSSGETPSQTQVFQTLVVAISSGVIATVLFFSATNKVRKDEKSLAAVEATQSSEVIFSLAGELLLINVILPDAYALIGMALVILGMILHSIKS